MGSNSQFDIFDFVGIDVTDDLETIQKALDALPASKMAELMRNPAFSSMRRFLFSKTKTPEFLGYVRPLLQKQKRRERYKKNKLIEEQRRFLEEFNKREEEAKRIAEEMEQQAKKLAEEQEQEAKRRAEEQEREAKINEQSAKLQHLADQFNQIPNRKAPFAFICSFLFTSIRNRWLLYNMFLIAFAIGACIFKADYVYLVIALILGVGIIPLCLAASFALMLMSLVGMLLIGLITLIVNIITNDHSYNSNDDSEIFDIITMLYSLPACSVWSYFYQYYLIIRALFLLKKGKFTVGRWKETKEHWEDDQGVWKEPHDYSDHLIEAQQTIQFKDDSGALCNTVIDGKNNHTSCFFLFYNYDIPHEKDEPCLVVYDPINRDINFPITALSNPQSDDDLGFRSCIFLSKSIYSDFNVILDPAKESFVQDASCLKKALIRVSITWLVFLLIFIFNPYAAGYVLFFLLNVLVWAPTYYLAYKSKNYL